MIPKNTSSRKKPSGYFGIGIEHLLSEENLGSLWRSAELFGASFIFTIGKKYKRQSSDVLKTSKSIPLFQHDDFESFYNSFPKDCKLIGIEIHDEAVDISTYVHFERSIYLLGSENNGLSKIAIEHCHDLIYIPSSGCLNVSNTGSIVLYDRISKNINL